MLKIVPSAIIFTLTEQLSLQVSPFYAMLQKFKAVDKYMQSLAKCLSPAAMEAAKAQQCLHLKHSFAAGKAKLDDAASVLEEMSACSWLSPSDRQELSSVVAAAADTADESSAVESQEKGKRHDSQKNDHFHDYLTEKDWQRLMSDCPLEGKVSVVVERALSVGMKWPCEATLVSMIAVATFAARSPVDPADSFRLLQTLKVSLRRSRWSSIHSSFACDLVVFPPSAEFTLLHSNCYTEGEPPVPSKVSCAGLAQRAGCIPARRTHSSLGLSASSHFRASPAGTHRATGAEAAVHAV
jgi:hypothetical protein